MRLDASWLPAYVALARPDAAAEDRAAALGDLVRRHAAGTFDPRDILGVVDRGGRLRAAVRLSPLAPSSWVLTGPVLDRADAGARDAAASLVPEAVARAREVGARSLLTRPLDGVAGVRYLLALADAGFERRGDRVEYRADVADLPADEGTALTWRTRSEVGDEVVLETLRRAALGDPHGIEPDETPAQALAEWLADVVLTHGPECVQVGYLEGRPVAFLCAQVNPATGWARITYMGLAPEVRRRGLGRAVHRHGFAMLRAQGGRLYHGGTAGDNAAMQALFRAAGCRVHARMSDWIWKA